MSQDQVTHEYSSIQKYFIKERSNKLCWFIHWLNIVFLEFAESAFKLHCSFCLTPDQLSPGVVFVRQTCDLWLSLKFQHILFIIPYMEDCKYIKLVSVIVMTGNLSRQFWNFIQKVPWKVSRLTSKNVLSDWTFFKMIAN